MEENKKNNVIISIFCLILAFACMFALLSIGQDEGIDVPSDTETGEDTDSGNTSQTNPAALYLDGDIGYRTIGNQTVFFLVCQNPNWYKTMHEAYKNTWYLTVDPKDCVSYEGLTVDIRYSRDNGVTWGSLTKVASDSTGYEGENVYALYNIAKEETIYLSYCFVFNCNDPKVVLSDLRDNVFDDLYSENTSFIDGTKLIEYYEDFPVYRNNYLYSDVVIPSG